MKPARIVTIVVGCVVTVGVALWFLSLAPHSAAGGPDHLPTTLDEAMRRFPQSKFAAIVREPESDPKAAVNIRAWSDFKIQVLWQLDECAAGHVHGPGMARVGFKFTLSDDKQNWTGSEAEARPSLGDSFSPEDTEWIVRCLTKAVEAQTLPVATAPASQLCEVADIYLPIADNPIFKNMRLPADAPKPARD